MATQTKLEKLVKAATGKPIAWYASPEGKNAMDEIAKAAKDKPYPNDVGLADPASIPEWIGSDISTGLISLAAREAELEKEYWSKDQDFWASEAAAALAVEIIENRRALGWPDVETLFAGGSSDGGDESDDDDEEPTDAPGKAYDLSLDNLSDSDFASALEMFPKAHPSIPPSNGKRNGVGLRYDHRYDDCAYLAARERSGACTVDRTPCPCLGGSQQTCPMYNPFRDQKAGPKPNERNTLYPKA